MFKVYMSCCESNQSSRFGTSEQFVLEGHHSSTDKHPSNNSHEQFQLASNPQINLTGAHTDWRLQLFRSQVRADFISLKPTFVVGCTKNHKVRIN